MELVHFKPFADTDGSVEGLLIHTDPGDGGAPGNLSRRSSLSRRRIAFVSRREADPWPCAFLPLDIRSSSSPTR